MTRLSGVQVVRIAFAGSPEFAQKVLKGAIERYADQIEIVAVWTQPPRRKGRGRAPASTPVARFARERGIEVHEPEVWNAASTAALGALDVDYLVTCAYGLILPREALSVPGNGAVNIHTSLLPRWRGAAPIQRALEAGDIETGITIFLIEEKVDTGPILWSEPLAISPDDTTASLLDKMVAPAVRGLAALVDHKEGRIAPIEQKHDEACYARKLCKEEGVLAWDRNAEEIVQKSRAFSPWPGVRIGDLKILKCRILRAAGAPGEVLSVDPLVVATGRHAIRLETVQRSGGTPMSGADYARGARLATGDRVQ